MGKIRLCILQNGLGTGGTDTFVVNLCRGLDKSRYDITVINPDSRPDYTLREDEVRAAGAKIIHTSRLVGLRGRLRHLWQLYWVLRRGKYDVFQTNIDLFNGPNILVAWLAGVPLRVCHSHNGRQAKELREGRTLAIRLYQGTMRWLCWHFSNRRCGCSELAMDFLFTGKNWRNVNYPVIINNGIDLSLFEKQIDISAKKKELDIQAPKNIITIGHIITQKNPIFIAKLFRDLCLRNSDCDFIWVGDGIMKPEVMKMLQDTNVTNRVHFFSKRKDVNEIMKCADLFILPSNFEGLGIVAIEAQASGLYCLLSDQVPLEADCGAARFLPIDKGTGVWVEEIEKHLYGGPGRKADPEVLDKFSIEHMTSQMSKVFES